MSDILTDRSLQGHRILVTGASSGIGQATVRAAAAAGARVAGLARRHDRLQPLCDEVGGFPVIADLLATDRIGDAVEEAASALGGLDTVVNNAGVYLLGGLSDGRIEDWRQMFEVNVIAMLAVTKAALPHLVDARGHIVNVSSLAGRRVARVSSAVYAATKHAVHALSEGMRLELREDGVRVTVVSPGNIDTEFGVGTRDPQLIAEIRERQERCGLAAGDVAAQIVHALTQPRHVLLNEIAIMPQAQEG